MYGRNGIDGLGIFLFALTILIRNIAYYSRSGILNLINIILLVVLFYRILSKDILRRSKENDFFMYYFRKVYSFFANKTSLARERARVKQTHKIYLCPKCKRRLKVPKGKGKIEIKCMCGNKFFKRT